MKCAPKLWDDDADSGHQAIRYFEWCVSDYMKNTDPAIHNYLMSLYAKVKDDTKLLQFLERRIPGTDGKPIYDLKYALRLCTRENKIKACVSIYSTMELYEEAVDLALSVDLQLAMNMAELPQDDELRKKLWLSIARHVVTEEKNIDKAMAVLHRNELLKIEDILPFFPDFVTIDHFKEAIEDSLKEYNTDIETLKREMDHATASAHSIRDDIQMLRHKYVIVTGDEVCALTGYPLLSKPHFKFPCGHGFHADALEAHVTKTCKPATRRRLDRLNQQVSSADVRLELDEIIAGSCPECGEGIINTIDEPFIAPDEQEAFMQTWSLA